MRFEYKLIIVLSLLLSTISLVSLAQAATIYGGKVYQGDNFTSSVGGIFLVHGTDSYTVYNNDTGYIELYYKTMIISSSIDDTVAIKNGTCKATRNYNYCYKGSAIDMKSTKTFLGDFLQPRMEFYIETLPNPSALVTVQRNTTISAYCGQFITIPLVFTNAGTMPTNITYTETLPLNTLVTTTDGGNVDGNIITFKSTLWDNSSKNYSYTITNFDCQPKSWSAKYSFTNFNSTVSKNLTNLSIVMLDSYTANHSLSVNKTNDPKTTVIYMWNITNNHESKSLMLNLNIFTPGLIVNDVSPSLILMSENRYKYSGTLPVDGNVVLYMRFHANNYGNYIISSTGTVSIDEYDLPYNSSDTLIITPPKAVAFIDFNNIVNKSLYVNVWIRNDDMVEKYYYIYGNLKGMDEGSEPLYANFVLPNNITLVGTQFYNTTGLGVKNVTFVFDGIYRDKNSMEYKLYAENTVNLNSPTIPKSNVTSSTVGKTNQTSTNKTVGLTNTTNTKNNPAPAVKKDFITRMLEALNGFLQSVFG